jgi:hypothetical protein
MSQNLRRLRHGVLVTLGVLVATLGLGVSGAPAGPKAVKPCISPTEVDLNERWGISDAIVAPFCTKVNSGRRWVPSNAWFMNAAFDSVPEEFVPAGATPLEDFVAKFIGVKYVVDPGTSKEKTYVFPNDDSLGIVNIPGTDIVNPITLGSLKPLSVGDHVVDSYLVFGAMHCDGFGDVVDENCLPAGETLYQSVAFKVTPGHN